MISTTKPALRPSKLAPSVPRAVLLATLGSTLLGCPSSPSGLDASDTGTDAADAPRSDAPRADAPVADVPSDIVRTDAAGTDGGTSPGCTSEPWPTYGHDAQRTFASGGCVSGVPREVWRYSPTAPSGHTVQYTQRVIAQTDAAFLTWSGDATPYVGSTGADRVTATGSMVWTFDSSTDASFGYWPSLALGKVVLDDDGIFLLDPATGMGGLATSVDYWGQTVGDDTHLYVSNTLKADGPGLFVGELDTMAHNVWTKNTYGMCGAMQGEIAGGIALFNGTLFYAPKYVFEGSGTPPLASGVYAFDANDGTQRWFQTYSPSSAISVGHGLVYFVDNNTTLYALQQSDGTVAWQQTLMFAQGQAPVLAGNRVIVADNAGIHSFDATAGTPGWSATVSLYAGSYGVIGNGCAGGEYAVHSTSMIAAMGSGTLVATASTGVVILSLADGHMIGQVSNAMQSAHDPVLVGKRLYVTSGTSLIAYDAP